jgi:hypothetical protein
MDMRTLGFIEGGIDANHLVSSEFSLDAYYVPTRHLFGRNQIVIGFVGLGVYAPFDLCLSLLGTPSLKMLESLILNTIVQHLEAIGYRDPMKLVKIIGKVFEVSGSDLVPTGHRFHREFGLIGCHVSYFPLTA